MTRRLLRCAALAMTCALVAGLEPNSAAADNRISRWAAPSAAPIPSQRPARPDHFATKARAVLIMALDGDGRSRAPSGRVLFERDAEAAAPPASLTKIMTLWVALEAARAGEIDLRNRVLVSERAATRGGSTMHLRAGDRPRLEELLIGVMTLSGNDAATAVAEAVAGSEGAFVARMNTAAEALGLQASRFKNPTGLPAAGHVMSARDVAQLTLALMERYPGASRFSTPLEMTWNGVAQPNRNPLLALDFSDINATVDGVKTGYTRAAGFGGVFTARQIPPHGAAEKRATVAPLNTAAPIAAEKPTKRPAPVTPRRVLVVLAGLGGETARIRDGERALRWALERSARPAE